MAQTDFEDCLRILVEKEGSDLYYSTGAPPSAKFYGTLNKLSDVPLGSGEVEQIANSIMNDDQRAAFEIGHARSGRGEARVFAGRLLLSEGSDELTLKAGDELAFTFGYQSAPQGGGGDAGGTLGVTYSTRFGR